MDKLPETVYELIQKLDADHPPYCIRRGESLEDAHRRAGRRELIDMLVYLRDEEAAVTPADQLLR